MTISLGIRTDRSAPHGVASMPECRNNPRGARARLPVPPLTLQVTKGSKEADTMSSSPSRRMKIGDFLFRRLEEAGVQQLFGVPGDARVH
jgi:hypothetical protein